jgi:hypothetical protein
MDLADLTPVIGAYKVRFEAIRRLFATVRLIEDGNAIAWEGFGSANHRNRLRLYMFIAAMARVRQVIN